MLCPPIAMGADESPPFVEFSSPSGPPGPTLFARLNPSQTGLEVNNAYDDPQMWGSRYRAFMGGGMGSGVAVGDFDNDGKPDLYVSTKTKPGRLFRNRGGWRFEDVTVDTGLAETASVMGWIKSAISSDEPVVWRQGATFADVNNDGWLDLYVCRNNATNFLYMNQGDGTFVEEAESRGLGIIDGSVIGAFADFDRDGWLDVLVLTNQVDGTEPLGRNDRLFRNRGNGYFAEVTTSAGIRGPTFGHSATWLDYDNDRWPDIYLANDFSGPDYLYRNNHDGTFTNVIDTVTPHTPYSSMGADLGDINNDGHPDLLVADMATTSREKHQRGLAASHEDVLAMGTRPATAPQYTRNALLLNTGRGVFAETAYWSGLAATDWTWSLLFEDFDNDGWTDLHVTNGMVREANNRDLLNRMMRALSDSARIRVMKNAPLLAEANLAYRNRRDGRFEAVSARWGLDEVGVSFGAAAADFDSDGDLDLVVLNHHGGLTVHRNDTAAGNRVQIRLRGVRSNRYGVDARVRLESASTGSQSRTITVARGYASGGELVAHFGLGPDEVIQRLDIAWPSGANQVFTHLPANRAYLIKESDNAPTPAPAPPAWFEETADTMGLAWVDASSLTIPDHEQIFLPFRTDRRGPGVAVADVNGDGQDDVYLGATSGSPARLLLWQDGTYRVQETRGLPHAIVEEGPPLWFDADGDGSTDLLVTRASANSTAWPEAFQPTLFKHDGELAFSPTPALPPLRLNVGAAGVADIDGDGDLDLFLGGRSVPGLYPENPLSVLLRNEGGRFVDVTAGADPFGELGLVTSALFRDVDQDGRPDLVIATEWDTVHYFHNEDGRRFSDHTKAAGFTSGGKGWWSSLASADFNGDGRLDFAVGNLGLNTFYRATPSTPVSLLYGDFAQNGSPLLVEATTENGTLYPVRSREELGARLPFILRKFRNNDDFARAPLRAILSETAIADAVRLDATNFSSGVFLSQPDGSFQFEALPPLAQLGPIQGLVATDLDGDGHADLAAVQNSDAAVPRFHGGVGAIMRGHGDGSFTVLRPDQSGLVAPGNGRALVTLDPDGDGRPGLFYTQHGGRSAFLQPQSPATSGWLAIRLRGTPGNPSAIGALVRIEYAEGSTTTHEIGSGGGWFSQSAPIIHAAVPGERAIVAVAVRWPDGRQTRHTGGPDSGSWILNYDSTP